MEHIGKHIKKDAAKGRSRATERGELLRYFMDRLNYSRSRDGLPALTMPRMGRIVVAIPTSDLYYLKSVCDQSKDFSKKFWWEVKPKKENTPPGSKESTDIE